MIQSCLWGSQIADKKIVRIFHASSHMIFIIYVILCQHLLNHSLYINLIITKNEFQWQYARLIWFWPLTV